MLTQCVKQGDDTSRHELLTEVDYGTLYVLKSIGQCLTRWQHVVCYVGRIEDDADMDIVAGM